ncbi:condensation domain-containing protein, partial [Rhizobium leguminosarum]
MEQLQPQRDLSRQPLFQVMFVLQNVPHEVLELPGLRLTPTGRVVGSAKFDLLLQLFETDDGLRGSLEYATDLFDRESMERLA